MLAARSHPDLHWVDTKDEEGKDKGLIEIEKIRRLNSGLRLTSTHAAWRVVVIDSADALNRNAANALLKILEEPPERTAFLMPCHAAARVPATFLSRCRRLRFAPLSFR